MLDLDFDNMDSWFAKTFPQAGFQSYAGYQPALSGGVGGSMGVMQRPATAPTTLSPAQIQKTQLEAFGKGTRAWIPGQQPFSSNVPGLTPSTTMTKFSNNADFIQKNNLVKQNSGIYTG